MTQSAIHKVGLNVGRQLAPTDGPRVAGGTQLAAE